MSNFYDDSIILIGPSGAGKTTVSCELYQITGMSQINVDSIANRGIHPSYNIEFRSREEYNLYIIRRILRLVEQIGKPRIIDFGAGYSVYDDEGIFQEVKKELSKFRNIVLLMPSTEIEKSLNIMRKRRIGEERKIADNRRFITSPCNGELATMTIYGEDKNPKQIAKEIINQINRRKEKEEPTK